MKARKEAKQLQATAYHEAGHAVATAYLWVHYPFGYVSKLRKVTIIPEAEQKCLGCAKHNRILKATVERLGLGGGRWLIAKDMLLLENSAVVTYAGPLAEKRFTGRWNHAGSKGDRETINEYIYRRLGEGSDMGSDDFLREFKGFDSFVKARASTLVNALWEDIKLIANRLLEVKTLTGDEVLLLVFPDPRGRARAT